MTFAVHMVKPELGTYAVPVQSTYSAMGSAAAGRAMSLDAALQGLGFPMESVVDQMRYVV